MLFKNWEREQPARIATYAELPPFSITKQRERYAHAVPCGLVMLFKNWERGPLARNALMALLKQIFHCLQLPKTATVQTPPMLNEYFGVGVTSKPRMASAAVEP